MVIDLGLDEKTAVKAVLARAIVYSGTVEGGQCHLDFDDHDPAKGNCYWLRYE